MCLVLREINEVHCITYLQCRNAKILAYLIQYLIAFPRLIVVAGKEVVFGQYHIGWGNETAVSIFLDGMPSDVFDSHLLHYVLQYVIGGCYTCAIPHVTVVDGNIIEILQCCNAIGGFEFNLLIVTLETRIVYIGLHIALPYDFSGLVENEPHLGLGCLARESIIHIGRMHK